MPTNYMDMTVEDMDCDGGFSWKNFWKCVSLVGAIVAIGAGIVAVTIGTGGTGFGVAMGVMAGGGATFGLGFVLGGNPFKEPNE